MRLPYHPDFRCPCPSRWQGEPKCFELSTATKEKPTYPFQDCNLKNWF